MAQQQQSSSAGPWPLFDLFLDLPHPSASKGCPPPFLIPSPDHSDTSNELNKNVPQIAAFAFPEYETTSTNESSSKSEQQQNLNKYDQYAMQPKGFQHFTFTMQLQTGVRVHGHVRRYLPPHLVARTRYDVGRRGERALVIMTRASGADLLYAAILKSVDAISSQQAAMYDKGIETRAEPQKWFLHELFRHQQHLAKIYASKPMQERGKPLICTLEGLEIGNKPMFAKVDTNRFIFPTCLLHRVAVSDPSAIQSSSLLPLLRCVGVAHALRIMSALLSERRVVMVSSSPTRLASCSHSALGMLAQGLLHWQHLYIPVLPPHLWQYLAAPYPYLIGILSSNLTKLDRTDGLGEVLMIHLDSNTMETRGMDQSKVNLRLPDLFQNQDVNLQGGAASASELLAQDLIELLKTDKRTLYGESTFANVSEKAAKAGKAVKNTFFKLRDKGREFLQNRSGSDVATPEESLYDDAPPEAQTLSADYIYTEGCHNAAGEEEARIAFATFFLCMFGNMRWYASMGPNQTPVLDRNRFLQQKRSMGEGEGTPIWPLLQNFCQTQMLEEFANARIEEVRTRQPITPDTSLFLQCAHYLRQHNIDFGVLSVRRITQQVAQGSSSRLAGMVQTNARRMAMSLTSNKPFEGDYSRAIANLVEECRESSCVLFDVMSVIWLRLRDSRGMQWKHGYHALQILKNLLYHGPLAAVAEATDGLEKIRSMKFYDHMRFQTAQDIRAAASLVFNLLVDRAKLFHIRRVCAERRRVLKDENQPRLVRDTRLRFNIPFKNIHAGVSPQARGTIARIPSAAPTPAQQTMQRGAEPEDLFGFSSAPPQQVATSQPPPPDDDMLGLFDSMSVSSSAAAADPFQPVPTPFDQPRPQGGTTTPVSTQPRTPVPTSGPPVVTGPAPAPPQQRGQQQAPAPPPQQFTPTIAQIPPKANPPSQVGPPRGQGPPPHQTTTPPPQVGPGQSQTLPSNRMGNVPQGQHPQQQYRPQGQPPPPPPPPPPQQQRPPPQQQRSAQRQPQQQYQQQGPPPQQHRPPPQQYPPNHGPPPQGRPQYPTQQQAPPQRPPGQYGPPPGGPPQGQPGYAPQGGPPQGYPPSQQPGGYVQQQPPPAQGAPPPQQQPPPPQKKNISKFDPLRADPFS